MALRGFYALKTPVNIKYHRRNDMLEQRKERQCQIRLTDTQYNYLQLVKREKKCTGSAYFRGLLVADMKNNSDETTNQSKGGK